MDPKRVNFLSLAGVLVLVALAVWLVYPPATKIKQGLDLQGGLSVVMTADSTKVTSDPSIMDRALYIIQNRVNGLGVSEATVQKQGVNALLIQLPGVKNVDEALKAIGSTGQMQFVEWASIPATAQAQYMAYDKAVQAGTTPKPLSAIEGTYNVLMTGETIASASAQVDSQNAGSYRVLMTFNDKGATEWGNITTKYVKQQIAVVLDGVIQSAPTINEPILSGDTEISGSFTAAEAKQLATVLQSGALPVTLKFSDTQQVGPTLGAASLRQGVLAALAGLLLVAIFLAAYYRGLGVLAWLSLGIFATLYLGVLAGLSAAGMFALSLPGIAGMVLSVGLAADTSILMFERFKEEVGIGRSPRSAAKSGTKHALLTSVDADLVTFVSAICLYMLAIGPVRGFALTLIIGLCVDLTVGLLFTRPTIILLAESVITKAPALFGVKGGASRA